MFEELKQKGIQFIRNVINKNGFDELREALDYSFAKHKAIQEKQNNEIDVFGVALNVLPDHEAYFNLLHTLIAENIIENLEKEFFKSKFILNSISALDNQPHKSNFSAIVHRDIKCYSHGMPLMLNMLVLLDDFTEENGATLLLPYSHKIEEKPSEAIFKEYSIKAIGKAGDILLFDSNIWHCSSLNTTEQRRRAIPITFTKSFMKQLFDYPRAIGMIINNEVVINDTNVPVNDKLTQLIGYHSRVPASLQEWYLPQKERFYKKDQD